MIEEEEEEGLVVGNLRGRHGLAGAFKQQG